MRATNESIGKPKGEYGYGNHQNRMIDSVSKIGITLSRSPKNDFLAVEKQVLKLIDSVNLTFDPDFASSNALAKFDKKYI